MNAPRVMKMTPGEAFAAVTTKLMFVMMTLALILAIHANPKEKAGKPGSAAEDGTMMVTLRWADGLDVDLDLWTKASADQSVGYSNKGGAVFNLMRDDLGMYMDMLPGNYETATTRGLPPGEYVVNVHLYRNRANVKEVPYSIEIITKLSEKDPKTLFLLRGKMTREGQEQTAIRFTLDNEGVFVANSASTIPKSLRAVNAKP